MTFLTPAFNDAKTYGFEWLRRLAHYAGIQEGVMDAGDLKVTQGTSGMRVTVAAGMAWIRADSGFRNGLGMAINDANIENALTLAASHATLPRIDQVCVRLNDSTDGLGTGVGDAAEPIVLQGTPTSGATLDNRSGAAALPNDVLRLADVLVPAASSSVTNANIRDRRPWARGAHRRIVRQANAAGANDYTTAGTTLASIDATNLRPRLELAGNPVRLTLMARLSHGTVGAGVHMAPRDNGAAPPGATGDVFTFLRDTNSSDLTVAWAFDWSPVAGSHLLEWAWRTTAGTASLFARSTHPAILTVEELALQDADNT